MDIYSGTRFLFCDVEKYDILCQEYENLMKIDYRIKSDILFSDNFKCDKVFVDMNNGNSLVKEVLHDRFICYEDSVKYRDKVLGCYAKEGYDFQSITC